MAKHAQKSSSFSRHILIVLAIFVVLSISAAVFMGALLAGRDQAADQGVILPDGVVLQNNNELIPLENGGFAVVSSDESETRLAFLTRDGALTEDPCRLPHLAERVFVSSGMLYIAGGFQSSSVDWMNSGITRVPLHSANSAGIETFTCDQEFSTVDIRSLCGDENGNLYAVDTMSNSIVCFSPDAVEERETVSRSMDSDVILEGLAIHGETVYLNSYSPEEGTLLWQGSLFDGTITDLQVLPEAELLFPLTFLSEDLVLDDIGHLFSLTETGSIQMLDAPDFYGAAVDNDGNLIGITDTGRIDLFAPGNYAAPVCSYQEDGEITAVACSGGIAVLLFDEDHYRYLLLEEDDFDRDAVSSADPEQQVSSEPSEPADESSDTSAEDATSSGNGDLDIPINSRPEDSSTDSSVSSDSKEEESSDTDSSDGDPGSSSDTVAMADTITSTEFSIDRGSNIVYLPANTTVARFRSTVPLHGATLTAYQYNGSVFQSGTLGTGMTLQLFNGDTAVDALTVIVLGDLNGNGTVNTADERLLYQHLTEEQLLTGYFYSAADMDQDTTVDTRDLLLLKRQLAH